MKVVDSNAATAQPNSQEHQPVRKECSTDLKKKKTVRGRVDSDYPMLHDGIHGTERGKRWIEPPRLRPSPDAKIKNMTRLVLREGCTKYFKGRDY